MTKEIEIIDDLSITFHFGGPFLDFMLLYGSTAPEPAGIVPSGLLPGGRSRGLPGSSHRAGPFKFVENQDNVKIVYEAFGDYWRKTQEFRH